MHILQTTQAVLYLLLVKNEPSDSKTQKRLPVVAIDTHVYTGISATHLQKTRMQSVSLLSGWLADGEARQ